MIDDFGLSRSELLALGERALTDYRMRIPCPPGADRVYGLALRMFSAYLADISAEGDAWSLLQRVLRELDLPAASWRERGFVALDPALVDEGRALREMLESELGPRRDLTQIWLTSVILAHLESGARPDRVAQSLTTGLSNAVIADLPTGDCD